ncbi:MAG: lysoplasmalogenase [Pseudomonas sp.]
MSRPLRLLCLALLGAALYLYALAYDNVTLGLAAKPIPVLVMLFWLNAAPPSLYRRWIVIGLGFSVLGDIVLAIPKDLFVFGLAAFLCAHLAYLRAYLSKTLEMTPWALLAALACGGLLLNLLIRGGLGDLLIPVAIYAAAITAMLWRALACAGLAALGAIAFVFSDSMIGIDRFVSPFAAAPYLIILAYWLGQWAIAGSVYTHQSAKALTQGAAPAEKLS